MRRIPALAELPLGRDGAFTVPWRQFLEGLDKASTSDALQGQIAELRAAIEALPDPIQASGQFSVEVQQNGSQLYLWLVGDTAEPGASYFYGTGPDGAKGFFPVASAFAPGTNVALDTDPDTGVTTINSTGGATVFNRIDAAGDIRVAADGSLRITD